MEQHRWRVDEVAAEEGIIATMEEHKLAEQIEAMRDDDEAWGEPEPERKRKSEHRQRGAMVSVRLSPDELASVQAHAAEAGSTVSGYLRDLALAAARQPVVIVTWAGGASINSSATDQRFLVRHDQVPACLSSHAG
jgi:predicted DNA binding CopG/RHH family protein